MKQYTTVLLLILASAAILQLAELVDPECVDSADCGAGRCCVLGSHPHSLPTCHPLGEDGDVCRPNNEPHNITVHYPDGDSVHLTNVYSSLCRCAEGLRCDEFEGGVCR